LETKNLVQELIQHGPFAFGCRGIEYRPLFVNNSRIPCSVMFRVVAIALVAMRGHCLKFGRNGSGGNACSA
jgi:hypothetical protein